MMESYHFPAKVLPGERENADDLPAPDAYVWRAEISSDRIDAYFTHMAESTLRNFANDAAAGVTFLDSHNSRQLGYGQSLNGQFEVEGDLSRVIAEFYTVPGVRFGSGLSYQSTDDFIKAVQARLVRDVSVGFYGGDVICDICGNSFYDWRNCDHWPGDEYAVGEQGKETVIATFEIVDARLAEVSAVYDGATPGAMIQRANEMAQAGALDPAMARRLETKYRIKLPDAAKSWRGVETKGAKTMADEKPTNNELDQIRALLGEAGAEGETATDRLRWLIEEVARLTPLADQGRQYRSDTIDGAIAEGVRAMGEQFPEETYREMFKGASLETIKLLHEKWQTEAGRKFPGGRQTDNETETKPEQQRQKAQAVPDEYYQS